MRSVCLSSLILIVVLAIGSFPGKARTESPGTSPQKPKPTPTKSAEPLLSKQEQEIISEINLARSDPPKYAAFLEDFRSRYNGKVLKFSDGSLLVTNEGVAALNEAIAFLRATEPVPPFEIRKGLVLAAKAHLEDLVKTGRTGHRGSDGSKLEDRFNRYGNWSDSVGEDIIYRSRSPRENVISLIIDDGVSNRGHRKNLFKESFKVVGIAVGATREPGEMCVITFAGGFLDRTASGPTPMKY